MAESAITIGSGPKTVIITVKEPQKSKDEAGDVAKFTVSKDKVMSKSRYFRANISINESGKHGDPVLEDDNILAMHIWFLCMHDIPYGDWSPTFKAKIDIKAIWHVINAADKYRFDDKELGAAGESFFDWWYDDYMEEFCGDLDEVGEQRLRSLAMPCHFFDHVSAFAKITKWLVYNCPGHISEEKPVKFKWDHLHLCPPDFVSTVDRV